MRAEKQILGENIGAYISWLGRLTGARCTRDEQLEEELIKYVEERK